MSLATEVAWSGVEVLLALIGGYWLVRNPTRFDGQTPLTTRGVRLYLLGLCAIFVVLGMAVLVLVAVGDG